MTDLQLASSKMGDDGVAAFDQFNKDISRTLGRNYRLWGPSLFLVDVPNLNEVYLEAFLKLPEEGARLRQEHNCRCCRRFLKQAGGLVFINELGDVIPALWDPNDITDVGYASVVAELHDAVIKASVNAQFFTASHAVGRPWEGNFQHFAIGLPAMPSDGRRLTAGQRMALSREEHGTLARGLAEYPQTALETVLELYNSGIFLPDRKISGQAEFLISVHQARDLAKGQTRKKNVLWRYIARAPRGWCRPKTTVIGALLDDVLAGKSVADIKRKHVTLVAPENYKRPKATPKDGAVARAETLFAQMGLAASLPRRHARLEEITAFWTPKDVQAQGATKDSLFGHLKQTPNAKMTSLSEEVHDGGRVSWEKFAEKVLPTAVQLEYRVEARPQPFFSFTTQANPDAKPIFAWDLPEQRNPVSYYSYTRPVLPRQFSLAEGWVKVNALTRAPALWFAPEQFPQYESRVVFAVLDGARDQHNAGLALFPDCLIADLHEVRAVIEAYSNGERMQGGEEATAAGVYVPGGGEFAMRFKVLTDKGLSFIYLVDRAE